MSPKRVLHNCKCHTKKHDVTGKGDSFTQLCDILSPISVSMALSIRDHKCNNKYIRSVFIDRLHPNRNKRYYIFKDFNPEEVKELRMNYLTFPSLPKVKEIHFKIINDIYPSKELLKSKFDIGENSCQFCETDIETTEHIFYYCNHSKLFWSQLHSKLSCIITCVNPLEYKQIKFGVLKKDCSQHYLVNNLFKFAKYFY